MNVRCLLPGLALFCGATLGYGAAPETLADTVFRRYFVFSGVSNAGEATTIFTADGRCISLKRGQGVIETPHSEEVLPTAHWAAIWDPAPDARYEYRKTGENTGLLTIYPDGGTPEGGETLYFSSSNAGSTSPTGLRGLGGNAFYLTHLSNVGNNPLSNVALRGRVAPGQPLVAGFTIPAGSERELLIRVIGPSLREMGISAAWNKSALRIYRNGEPVFAPSFSFPYWSETPKGPYFAYAQSPEAGLRKIFSYVGAFPLASGSNDTAVVIRLAPGSYSAVAEAETGDPGGEALIEIYPLP